VVINAFPVVKNDATSSPSAGVSGSGSSQAEGLGDAEKTQVTKSMRGSMKSILDRSFRYTPSVETDLRKTFARIRRRLQDKERAHAKADADTKNKVLLMDQLKKASTSASTGPYAKPIEQRGVEAEAMAPASSRK